MNRLLRGIGGLPRGWVIPVKRGLGIVLSKALILSNPDDGWIDGRMDGF